MLHVVFRSYGGENGKDRPPFYSKSLALASLVRAVEETGANVDVTFLNDGPIPAERMALMRSAGTISAHARLGFRGSYHAGLALPLQRHWPDEDLVWFSEDDYLYQPRALRDLIAAADALPQAQYLALYASIGERPPEGGVQPDYASVPSSWHASQPVDIHGHAWRRALSTTWTFGVRMSTLRRDHAILSLTDYCGLGGCDHAMCLHYQGERPYPWRQLARELTLSAAGGPKQRVKRFIIVPAKAAMNVWSLRRIGHGHEVWAADPALATHMQTGHLGTGTDWEALARSTAEWAARRGVDLSPPGFASQRARERVADRAQQL